MAIQHLSVHDHAAADTRSEGYHDEILHATGCSIGHLTHSGRVGVVGNLGGHAELLLQQLSKGNNTFPRQVRSLLNIARVVVGIRGTGADTANHLETADRLYNLRCLLVQGIHVVVDVCVLLCLNGDTSQYLAACIYNTEDGVSTSHVQT